MLSFSAPPGVLIELPRLLALVLADRALHQRPARLPPRVPGYVVARLLVPILGLSNPRAVVTRLLSSELTPLQGLSLSTLVTLPVPLAGLLLSPSMKTPSLRISRSPSMKNRSLPRE